MKSVIVASLTGLILFALPNTTLAADSKDPDWPCVQRKIPSLSLGMMWGGPIPEEKTAASPDVERLARLLAVRRTGIDEVAPKIEAFAATLQKSERNRKLTELVSAVLDAINAERRAILAGIERYTVKQRTLANKVRDTRKQLDAVLAIETPTENDDKRRREVEQALLWQTRIHDDRERSLKYVCESPVLLEQRAFAVAREIANHLEQ